MTILRGPADYELHNDDGTHIDPGDDRNLKAKLKRHLARHARGDLPEIGMLKFELDEADRMVREAEEHREAIRVFVGEQAEEHKRLKGVAFEVTAAKLGVPVRKLYDWVRFGKRRGGANRGA